jgi:hypothetical protein
VDKLDNKRPSARWLGRSRKAKTSPRRSGARRPYGTDASVTLGSTWDVPRAPRAPLLCAPRNRINCHIRSSSVYTPWITVLKGCACLRMVTYIFGTPGLRHRLLTPTFSQLSFFRHWPSFASSTLLYLGFGSGEPLNRVNRPPPASTSLLSNAFTRSRAIWMPFRRLYGIGNCALGDTFLIQAP